MKRGHNRVILALCAALTCTVAAVAVYGQEAEAAAERRPKAVVENPIFDAQRVDVGDQVVADFVVRNEGDAPLHITDVRPTCGCTVAEYPEVIAPGESGTVHAVLDTSNDQGGISKGITVLTDDAENPHFVLTIKAVVAPAIFVNPGFARFIQPQLSDPGHVGELLFSSEFENLEVVGVDSPYPFLTATARPARVEEQNENGKGRQWVVELTLDYTEAPVGALADNVVVRTNHPKQEKVLIPVSGFIRPMVVATPDDIDFGDIEIPAEGLTTHIVVKSYASEGIDLTVQQTTIPGVTVDVEPIRPGHEYSLMVTLPPELPMGSFSGKIELKLDHPKKKSLEIPLHGKRI